MAPWAAANNQISTQSPNSASSCHWRCFTQLETKRLTFQAIDYDHRTQEKFQNICQNSLLKLYIYYSVRKVSDLIFLRKSGGSQSKALARGDLEPSYVCVNFFFRISIVPVDDMQHLSEVWFLAKKSESSARNVLEHYHSVILLTRKIRRQH